jgi:hypothetical protein
VRAAHWSHLLIVDDRAPSKALPNTGLCPFS